MTIKEAIEAMQEPYRSKAIENIDDDISLIDWGKMHECLCAAFIWRQTKQGFAFWNKYHDKLKALDI